ncbi:MAG: mannitol dehydrogenase family protein [Lachnospiraceae bacterium]|nr:mannitol dehydrogenase family protein [Lachnospiraceae bacterium]
MKLTDQGTGTYREPMTERTLGAPEWIHFGAGNIFRAFMADMAQVLISEEKCDTGVIVVEGYDPEIIEKIYRPHDNLAIIATLRSDGTADKKVIGSIAASFVLDGAYPEDLAKLEEMFENPTLKMCSFTITEKGYSTKEYMRKIVLLLLHRYKTVNLPVAFVSMDNCSHNGEILHNAIEVTAKDLIAEGLADEGFLEYINDRSRVSFPWTMIDKITPRPDEGVYKELIKDGWEDLDPIVTTKGTYIAPFVNAEETGYLVIEDDFPNGRIPLDEAGAVFTDRDTVNKTERMKVCTCLNPLHTALAIFGCLLGYKTIHDEMEDEDLKNLVYTLGYKEGMPVVTDPGVIAPDDFLETVLTKRLPNPFMPDSPQRIATDTSQKIPIRFGETIKAYRNTPDLGTDDLTVIPLVLAGYLRYLNGTDDEGRPFDQSSDPMLSLLTAMPASDVLKKKEVFGCDMFEDGLGDRVLKMYDEMCRGEGSIRKTLHKYVTEV